MKISTLNLLVRMIYTASSVYVIGKIYARYATTHAILYETNTL